MKSNLISFITGKRKNRIYFDGADNIGWSIDSDRKTIVKYLDRDKFELVSDWSDADIIHNVWWNNIFNTIPDMRKKKKRNKLLVTCSNFIDFNLKGFNLGDEFNAVREVADGWICPSTKQKRILDSYGVRTFYLPFGIDLDLFSCRENRSRNEICSKLSIDPAVFHDRVVIGSFQRDSLGSNLLEPKWQKNPELLIDLLKDLPKNKYILFIAGPRRHYVIRECRKHGIPYYYYGNETSEDDIEMNAVDLSLMPDLYRLVDVYLVTSVSEGGPKAPMEASAMKTFIMSTDVGLSADFIDNRFVSNDFDKYRISLRDIIDEFERDSFLLKSVVDENYRHCVELMNVDGMRCMLSSIYSEVLGK